MFFYSNRLQNLHQHPSYLKRYTRLRIGISLVVCTSIFYLVVKFSLQKTDSAKQSSISHSDLKLKLTNFFSNSKNFVNPWSSGRTSINQTQDLTVENFVSLCYTYEQVGAIFYKLHTDLDTLFQHRQTIRSTKQLGNLVDSLLSSKYLISKFTKIHEPYIFDIIFFTLRVRFLVLHSAIDTQIKHKLSYILEKIGDKSNGHVVSLIQIINEAIPFEENPHTDLTYTPASATKEESLVFYQRNNQTNATTITELQLPFSDTSRCCFHKSYILLCKLLLPQSKIFDKYLNFLKVVIHPTLNFGAFGIVEQARIRSLREDLISMLDRNELNLYLNSSVTNKLTILPELSLLSYRDSNVNFIIHGQQPRKNNLQQRRGLLKCLKCLHENDYLENPQFYIQQRVPITKEFKVPRNEEEFFRQVGVLSSENSSLDAYSFTMDGFSTVCSISNRFGILFNTYKQKSFSVREKLLVDVKNKAVHVHLILKNISKRRLKKNFRIFTGSTGFISLKPASVSYSIFLGHSKNVNALNARQFQILFSSTKAACNPDTHLNT